jgi:hypothetical protein
LFRHGRRPLLQSKHNNTPCRLRTGFSFGPPPAGGTPSSNRPDEIQLVKKPRPQERRGGGRAREEEEEGALVVRKKRRVPRPQGRRGGRRDLEEEEEGKLAARKMGSLTLAPDEGISGSGGRRRSSGSRGPCVLVARVADGRWLETERLRRGRVYGPELQR